VNLDYANNYGKTHIAAKRPRSNPSPFPATAYHAYSFCPEHRRAEQ